MKPEPLGNLHRMNALQRATESFRYILLSIEQWISPNGAIRAWFKQNVRVGAYLFIPALLVMPAVGLILWQITGWISMITTITGKLVLILLLLMVARIFTALIKR